MSRQTGAAIGPLRVVVGQIMVRVGSTTEIAHELYECGHHALRKSDIYGPTFATRRRCPRCRTGELPNPKHVKLAEQQLAKWKQKQAEEKARVWSITPRLYKRQAELILKWAYRELGSSGDEEDHRAARLLIAKIRSLGSGSIG